MKGSAEGAWIEVLYAMRGGVDLVPPPQNFFFNFACMKVACFGAF